MNSRKLQQMVVKDFEGRFKKMNLHTSNLRTYHVLVDGVEILLRYNDKWGKFWDVEIENGEFVTEGIEKFIERIDSEYGFTNLGIASF